MPPPHMAARSSVAEDRPRPPPWRCGGPPTSEPRGGGQRSRAEAVSRSRSTIRGRWRRRSPSTSRCRWRRRSPPVERRGGPPTSEPRGGGRRRRSPPVERRGGPPTSEPRGGGRRHHSSPSRLSESATRGGGVEAASMGFWLSGDTFVRKYSTPQKGRFWDFAIIGIGTP